MKPSNPIVKISVLVLPFFAASLAACVDTVPETHPDDGKTPETEITKRSQLRIDSFRITPSENESVYGEIRFTPNADSTEWRASIERYRTDLSALIPVFSVRAARICVGEAEQKSGESVQDFTSEVVYRLYTTGGEYRDYKFMLENLSDSYTGFPLVALITEDGKPVESRDEWKNARMVLDPQDADWEAFSGAVEIKGRGHNSWSQPKKPYNIKLGKKTPLMGMNKHKRWCLLANAGDKTLLRNRVAYEIGRRTELPWTPDNRFVDVMLNGEFLGSYLLCEQIRVDENRVDIVEGKAGMAPDAVGYLLEIDRYYDEVNKFRSRYMDLPFNVKNPDEDIITREQMTYIADYVNTVEELLYGGETVDKRYLEYIDPSTFIDWWMVVELTGNQDPRLPGSCYMYKDAGEKLCAGPLWDFDLTTFRNWNRFLLYDYTYDPADEKENNRSLWYGKLFTDPEFKALAKERWNKFRPAFGTIEAFIDAEAAAIAVSAAENWKIWTISAGSNNDETLPWEEAVEKMKTSYRKRLAWIDTQIAEW